MVELDGPRRKPRHGGNPDLLVVLCHGRGADGDDLIHLAGVWSQVLPHAAFVAPDAPDGSGTGNGGREWWDLSDRSPAALAAGVVRAAGILDRFVDAELARLGLPPDAVALAGFSQGAMTALHLGLTRTPRPRAVIGLSGALLVPPPQARAADTFPPVLLVHGEDDFVVPVAATRMAEQMLRAAGVAVQAHYLPGLGHGIGPEGLALGGDFLARVAG